MKNENKTKDQIIQELVKMGKKITDLEEIIIEEKRTKKELKESEKEYKDLVEETPLGIINIGVTGKIIYINKRLEKISGYSREEIVGKNVFKLGVFPGEMLKILKERLKVRLRGGSIHQRREVPFKCKNGKWIWIEITAKLIKKWGIPANFRVTAQDITERKKAEEELRDSEERLEILFDYAPDAYYISDLKGKFIDGNKAAERLMGYKKEELIGKSFLKLNLLTLAAIPKAAKLLVKNLRGQPTGPDEFVINRKDNSKVTVEISTYPVKIKERTVVLGIARDITERKKAEEILRKSQQEFVSIFHNSPEASVYLDEKSRVLDINSRFGELFGYNLEEIKGKDINSGIIHPLDKIEEAKRLTKKAIKGYVNYDTIRKKKDGTLFPVSMVPQF
jgi:PAS domain S-box-containing protein